MPNYIQAFHSTGKRILGVNHLQCKVRFPRPRESAVWKSLPDWAEHFPDVFEWKLVREQGFNPPATLDVYKNPHYIGK